MSDSPQRLEPADRWTTTEASEMYDVTAWGKGYFSVSAEGHVCVHPGKDPLRSVDLKKLVDTLVLRGINPPILIRFGEILQNRLAEMAGAFKTAITEHNYKGEYQ